MTSRHQRYLRASRTGETFACGAQVVSAAVNETGVLNDVLTRLTDARVKLDRLLNSNPTDAQKIKSAMATIGSAINQVIRLGQD